MARDGCRHRGRLEGTGLGRPSAPMEAVLIGVTDTSPEGVVFG